MRIASLLSNTWHLALITFHFSLSSTLNEPLRSIPTVIPAPILSHAWREAARHRAATELEQRINPALDELPQLRAQKEHGRKARATTLAPARPTPRHAR